MWFKYVYVGVFPHCVTLHQPALYLVRDSLFSPGWPGTSTPPPASPIKAHRITGVCHAWQQDTVLSVRLVKLNMTP